MRCTFKLMAAVITFTLGIALVRLCSVNINLAQGVDVVAHVESPVEVAVSVCEVHGMKMHKERIKVAVLPQGSLGGVKGAPYYEASQSSFPNTGLFDLREGHVDCMRVGYEEVDVCPKCREAHRDYCSAHPGGCAVE